MKAESFDSAWQCVTAGRPPDYSPSFVLEIARNGAAGVAMDGRRLHSRHDPLVEAARAARAIVPAQDQLVLFLGAGLGYVVERFLAENSHECVWLEPFPELARHALRTVEVARALETRRLRLVVGLLDEDLLEDLFRGRANTGVLFYGHQASFAAHPAYGWLQRSCEQFLNRKSVNLATLARFDREWTRNLCQNFSHLLAGRPVASLFDMLPGGLALVCGAGPSLAVSFGEITRLRDTGVLIAVDTAVRPIVLAGLDPDIIVTVDPQAVNRHYLEDYRGNAIFVVDPTTSYHSLRRLPSDRIYYAASPFPLARVFCEEVHGPPGDISFGGSVSTNAYDLAIRLGCNRVLLYGQDFGFSGGLAHVRGAVLEERWNFMEARLRRRELHNHRQLSALPIRSLPRTGGGAIRTNDKLRIFHEWFLRRTGVDQSRGVEVVNRTQRGALLGNLPILLPAAGPPLPPTRFIAAAVPAPLPDPNASARLVLRLGTLVQSIGALARASRRGLSTAAALAEACTTAAGQSQRYANLLADMDACDRQVQADAAASEVVGSLMQGAIFRITEAFGGADGDDEREARLAAAEKTVALYRSLAESAEDAVRLIERAREVIGESGA